MPLFPQNQRNRSSDSNDEERRRPTLDEELTRLYAVWTPPPVPKQPSPWDPPSAETLLAQQSRAKSKDRFAVLRDERGRRGRFDLRRVHPLERGRMLREAESISKARPSNEISQLSLRSADSDLAAAYEGDVAAFQARNQYFAKRSRRLVPDLFDVERYLSRFYGIYGNFLNLALRRIHDDKVTDEYDPSHATYRRTSVKDIMRPVSAHDPFYFHDDVASVNEASFRTYSRFLGIGDARLIFSDHPKMVSRIRESIALDTSYATVLKNMLNFLIEGNHHLQPKTGTFYRIGRAMKGTYSNDEDFGAGGGYAESISPGDLIADWGLISASHNVEELLFQYSEEGYNDTGLGQIKPSEEEIIFVIKNTPALKYIDISGHKYARGQEKYTSSELLIRSNTRFRVLAIQDKPVQYPRRVVHLEADDDYYENDIIHDMYDGSLIVGDEI